MAVVQFEFLADTFIRVSRLAILRSPRIPVPQLEVLGFDRLIVDVRWEEGMVLVPDIQGAGAQAGTLLLHTPVKFWHVSIDELRVTPETLGTPANAEAWIRATARSTGIDLSLVAVAKPGAQAMFPAFPVRLTTIPLPAPAALTISNCALVWSERVVSLRLGTQPSEDVLTPMASPLVRALDGSPGSTTNWSLIIPASFFTEMLLTRFNDALSPPPDGVIIEESPVAHWKRFPGTASAWGVEVQVGLEKPDACPGVFGDIDVSIDVTMEARFRENLAARAIDIEMRLSRNTSDWDVFRCWIGSFGIGSLVTTLVTPLLEFPMAIASLIAISGAIGDSTGEALANVAVGDFTRVSSDDDSVTYAGNIPIPSVPTSTGDTMEITAEGLIAQGSLNLLDMRLEHEATFTPATGPLTGTWKESINCSHRSMDRWLQLPPIRVRDDVTALGFVVDSAPVLLFVTSMAEPSSAYSVKQVNPRSSEALIEIVNSKLGGHGQGWAVIHTSAGLRVYTIAGAAASPTVPLVPGLTNTSVEDLVNQYCDTFHELTTVIEIHELKWIEPPIDYGFGIPALRQWQVLLHGISEDARIETMRVRAGGERESITDAVWTREGRRAWSQFVTDADTELVIQVPDAAISPMISTMQRWLVPMESVPLSTIREQAERRRRTSLAAELVDVMAQGDADWERGGQGSAHHQGIVKEMATVVDRLVDPMTNRPLQVSVQLAGNRVGLIHDDHLMIALPGKRMEQGTSN